MPIATPRGRISYRPLHEINQSWQSIKWKKRTWLCRVRVYYITYLIIWRVGCLLIGTRIRRCDASTYGTSAERRWLYTDNVYLYKLYSRQHRSSCIANRSSHNCASLLLLLSQRENGLQSRSEPPPFLANARRFSAKPYVASRLTLVKPLKNLQAIASRKTHHVF